jgi:hypothetical protein
MKTQINFFSAETYQLSTGPDSVVPHNYYQAFNIMDTATGIQYPASSTRHPASYLN